MVRFSSGKTSVQLSVTDLEKPAGTVAESSRNAKQNIQQCNGSQDVNLPEVYITDPKDGMCTRFLGKNKDIPFLMAQAGSELRNTGAERIQLYDIDEERRTGTVTRSSLVRRGIYTPPSKPQALCLTVILEPKAFLSLEPKANMTAKDIKIDVFLNGQFFDRELVRYGSATPDGNQTVRFTGHRIRGPIEKPWILVPSGQNPDGTPARYRDRASDAPGKRWHAISKALLSSADGAGRTRDGEVSPLGECLESLALLPLQPEIARVRNPKSANFGVIDVVISWAKGLKVSQPDIDLSGQRFSLVEGYGYAKPVDLLVDATAEDTASRISNPDTAPRTPTNIFAGTDTFYENTAAYPTPPSCVRTSSTVMAPAATIGRSTMRRSPLAASSSRKRTRSASVLDPESQSKRPKLTLEQEIASIAKQAEEDNRRQEASKVGPQSTPANLRRKTRPIDIEESSANGYRSPDSNSLVETEDDNHTPGDRSSSKDSSKDFIPPTEVEDEDETDTPGPSQKANLHPPRNVISKAKGKEAASKAIKTPRPRIRTKAVSQKYLPDARVEVPKLSRDCVVTYAPPGLVRDVGASRKTFLIEEGAVIVAVRFLVG